MSKDIELNEMLLSSSKSPEVLRISTDRVDVKWLSDLFHPDNIRQKLSNRRIQQIGGYNGLQKSLRTNLKNGLSGKEDDLIWRRNIFGANDPIVKPPKTLWGMILENFEDRTIQILCFAAIASLILGIITHGIREGWLEGASIILAVVIISAVTSFNNYMKQKQFRKLNEVASRKNVNVTRSGQIVNMSVYQINVGDVVQIETGQIISVDGIIFDSNKMETDQSSITGESLPISKEDLALNKNTNPFLISGSKVIEGTGNMLVLAVGRNTRQGISKTKLQKEDDDTPLQQKLATLADQIGQIGIWSATLTFIALFIHLIIDVMTTDKCILCSQFLNALVGYFIIAVSIVVIAVPEGLPLAVTISLAYSVGKMKDQNNLVRFLAACETMGGANNICTDKTGTLTKNQMTVTKLWAESQVLQLFNKNMKISRTSKDMIGYGICLNSNANPKIDVNNKFDQIGNKTECALLQMCYYLGYDYRSIRKQHKIINTVPFSSSRKRMSCIAKVCGKFCIFTKGGPDFLLPRCSKYLDKNGQTSQIDKDFYDVIKHTITSFATHSLRTLLICYRPLTSSQANISQPEKLENDLIVLGLVGIKDPLKDSIPDAVNKCKKAGIIVRMVTGDNTQTATAIAKDANIIVEPNFERPNKGEPGYYIIMQGKQFREQVQGLVQVENSDKQYVKNIDSFKKIVKQLRVLARSSPQDKYLLATGLKQLGNVVAMTGDGTNDAPALKKADIGFAMGLAGTEVAKQAAGIILLDDNFGSIITAVKYGRNIFDCIRKFLQFQLTVNVVAIFMAFLGAVIIKQSPLTPVQMLWVNLIMDTLAALALATEPPSEDLLKRMPYSRKQEIITAQMWRGIILNSIFQIIVLMIMLFKGDDIFGVPSSIGLDIADWNQVSGVHLSLFFDVFVFLQVFNFFNARKLKKDQINIFTNISNNYLFMMIVIGIFLCQLFIVQFGGRALKLVPLTIGQHLICIVIGSLSLLNGVFVKKCIPDSFLNNFHLLRQQRQQQHLDADSPFRRFMRQPATERRSSKHRH